MIPALDEAERIENAVRALRRGGSPTSATAVGSRAGTGAGPGGTASIDTIDVVVVDGGSADDTAERALRAGARVLRTTRGRARQLEVGWRASVGEVVVFLHADTRLEDGWPAKVQEALADPGVVGGAFRLRFDRPTWVFRGIAAIAALRVRLFGLPYGDQGIFVRRRTLESLGGIRDVPLMEDLDLVAAMKARGRIVALRATATTSARRYEAAGLLRTLMWHGIALAGWRLGVDRARIARWVGR